MTTYYRTTYGYTAGDFPTTAAVFARSLALPMYQDLSAADQGRVVAALFQSLKELGVTNDLASA
jgi:dTDP-4-amino-4,6-dideoxygalactose transaminase